MSQNGRLDADLSVIT